MASRQSAVVREMYVRWAQELADPDLGSQQRVENGEHWADITREPRGVDYTETDEPGRPAMWITPKTAAPDRVILGLHGGGFVGGSLYTHRKLFGHLAKAVGARALLVHYRLNPEYHHPAPLHDAVGAYRWLLEQGYAAEHIALSGDSSGGGLCVTAVLRARELDLPLPAALLLMSPWVDMELTSETLETNREKDPYFHREFIQPLVDMHLSDGYSPKNPLVNPLHADLTGFPPMFVQAGADETGLGDAQRLAEHAKAAGVDVRLDVFPEQQHTFQMAAGYAPEADDALARFASWARPWLGL